MYCRTPKALCNHVCVCVCVCVCVGGVSPQPPPVCSIHSDDVTAATGQRRQCAHHTSATGGEERESKSQSRGWGLLGGHDWQGPVVGIWSVHRHTPLLFTRSAMGFLITTESQDLGLTSYPKDGAFWQYSFPVTILGCKDAHRPQGEHPLLASLTPLQQQPSFPMTSRRSPIQVLTRLNPA